MERGEHPLKEYNYVITDANIRKTPLAKRDNARLFVYDTRTDTVTFDYFYNLVNYLPKDSLLVLNNTGVIPARVTFRKDTGGKVNGLILMNEGFDEEGAIPAIVDENLFPGRKIIIDGTYSFYITRQVDQRFYLLPEFDKALLPEILMKYGSTPTPFYLGKIELDEISLRDRYQTIFAEDKKSVAAPTASLHFTDEVFTSLKTKGIVTTEITLDVGLGTFAEVEQKHIDEKKLHLEKFSISAATHQAISTAKNEGQAVIAVGTTVTRTLESQAKFLLQKGEGVVGATDMFIMKPYEFQIVDHLITNFHVPQSSLMALVDAFLAHKQAKKSLLELYEIAIKEGFMFYSFGDSMLIL
jgi:S-adenosylmethionine:tRNA ribosyltransferase-isomerase